MVTNNQPHPPVLPYSHTYTLDNGSGHSLFLIQFIPNLYVFTTPGQRLLYWIEYAMFQTWTRTSSSITHLTNLHTLSPILHTRYFWLHMCILPIVDSNRVFVPSVSMIAVYTSNKALIIINRVLIMVLHISG